MTSDDISLLSCRKVHMKPDIITAQPDIDITKSFSIPWVTLHKLSIWSSGHAQYPHIPYLIHTLLAIDTTEIS